MNYRQNMGPRYQTSPCPTSSCPTPACQAPSTPIQPRMADHPIAMAYVPDQIFQSTYDLHRALEVGTIFPELHKPFCGKRCIR